jgi:hypothetical protein
MIPITPEQLREQVKGWPVDDLRKAIRAALPELNEGMESPIAHWLLSDVEDPRLPLGAEQVAAIWRALYQRAQ